MLPTLERGASVYQSVREWQGDQRAARTGARRLCKALEVAATLIHNVSADTIKVLDGNVSAYTDGGPQTTWSAVETARQAMLEAARQLRTIESLFGKSPGAPRDLARGILSVWTAVAVHDAGLTLTKSRSGQFARVLAVVFHAVDPDHAPQEFFDWIRLAVEGVRAGRGIPEPRKGRPRGTSK